MENTAFSNKSQMKKGVNPRLQCFRALHYYGGVSYEERIGVEQSMDEITENE